MEVILYYNYEGKKQWIIAEKGNSVIQTFIATGGYKKKDFLVIDVTGQIDQTTIDSFGY